MTVGDARPPTPETAASFYECRAAQKALQIGSPAIGLNPGKFAGELRIAHAQILKVDGAQLTSFARG